MYILVYLRVSIRVFFKRTRAILPYKWRTGAAPSRKALGKKRQAKAMKDPRAGPNLDSALANAQARPLASAPAKSAAQLRSQSSAVPFGREGRKAQTQSVVGRVRPHSQTSAAAIDGSPRSRECVLPNVGSRSTRRRVQTFPELPAVARMRSAASSAGLCCAHFAGRALERLVLPLGPVPSLRSSPAFVPIIKLAAGKSPMAQTRFALNASGDCSASRQSPQGESSGTSQALALRWPR